MRKMLIAGFVLAACASSGPVMAQDYFMRERIEGLKPVANPAATFTWAVGGWSEWSSTCSDNSIRTRRVACTDGDGQVVADEACSATKPVSSETQAIRTGCVTYSWQPGDWSDWSSHCSDVAERTRTVSCVGSDGSAGSEAMCSGTKPATSQTDSVMDQCPPPKPACQVGFLEMEETPDKSYHSGDGVIFAGIGQAKNGKSVWRVRNTRSYDYDIVVYNISKSWTFSINVPAYTDVYLMSDVGQEYHRMDVMSKTTGRASRTETDKPYATPYEKCE